jgi:hypothetical protein
MLGHGLVLEQSRKYKAARGIYEHVRGKRPPEEPMIECEWEGVTGVDGVSVPFEDRVRVLNLRLHDEHMSPYFRTDMNLFHMLMVDEATEMRIYQTDGGWMFIFDGVPDGPQPFGNEGFDTR